MASPWKLLANLISPRRQQRHEQGSTDDAKPEVSAISKPTEKADDNGLNAGDAAVDERPARYHQSEVLSAEPSPGEETASCADGAVDIEGANLVETADPGASREADPVARKAAKAAKASEYAKSKRSSRGKKPERVGGLTPPSPAFPHVPCDAISLDREIRLLRNQLSRRLQLQNAQLKKMLERFEP
ncbi:hypothetical protein J4T85_034905 (plasmid) [Sinorhizobium medicae]|uniref:hypothetical protein n=1 Tax=Sinorhizobium medicae TaxID=110321 RepID=UPI001AAEF00E|nr:hypothetical protein [Sinorhizobium medicae]MBO1965473.1 hypothetical protein [Sinorhizobium medicae]